MNSFPHFILLFDNVCLFFHPEMQHKASDGTCSSYHLLMWRIWVRTIRYIYIMIITFKHHMYRLYVVKSETLMMHSAYAKFKLNVYGHKNLL